MFKHRTISLRSFALPCAALIAVTLIAYLPALQAGFIWDDDRYVWQNPSLHDGVDGLRDIWIPRNTPQYYPVVFTSFWLEHQLYPDHPQYGTHPFGYHLVNILLHAANALLIVLLLRRIGLPQPAAWATGFIFALHPVHVESVAWVTERKNILSGLFFLMSMLCYLRFDERRFKAAPASHARINRKDRDDPWMWYALAFMLFLFALLSKSITASLPVVIVLALLFRRQAITLQRVLPLLPMLIAGAVAGLHTAHIERVHVGAVGPFWDALTLVDRGLIAINALVFYPFKLVVPHPLVFIYPQWEIDPARWSLYLPLLPLVGAFGWFAWLWWKRDRRGPLLAYLFFGISVFPALGFANVYPHQFSFVADHFQYLASVGVIVLIIGAAVHLLPDTRRLGIILAAICLVLGALTFRQSRIYESEETLYRAVVRENPAAWMAQNNLAAIELRRAGDFANPERIAENDEDLREHARRALDHARAALESKPDHESALTNAAESLRLLGRVDEALPLLERAVGMSQQELEYHAERGYDRLIATSRARLSDNHVLLGRVLQLRGDAEAAREQYQIALRIVPDNAMAHRELGVMALADDRRADALRHFRAALAAPGALPFSAWIILGEDAIRRGAFEESQQFLALAEAVMTDPAVQRPALDYHLIWMNDAWGAALADRARYDEAILRALRAVQIAQDSGEDDLARRISERIDLYRRALEGR